MPPARQPGENNVTPASGQDSPPPSPPPETTVPVPAFSQPRPPAADPLPPDSQVTAEPQPVPGGSGSSGGPAGFTASTDRKVIEQAAAGIAGLGLEAAGGLLNMRLTPPEDEDTWLPDGQDLDQVAAPLGRIAARHVPLPDVSARELSDLQDAIAAAIGLAGWLIKGFAGWVGSRARARRKPAAAEPAAAAEQAAS